MDEFEWDIEVTIRRDGREVGTADVMCVGSGEDMVHAVTSELTDWGRREGSNWSTREHW